MARLLFEKVGNAVWISHLDLMRLFQRAFKRAGLPLKHTQGFNPRPSVSIAMPLSVGVQSRCELLDFELDTDEFMDDDICCRLNQALVDGVRVLRVYGDGRKLKDLALLACTIDLEYDRGEAKKAEQAITSLFERESIVVLKKGKNGEVEKDIAPMIKQFDASALDNNTVQVKALVCCQNPSLNPMQLVTAIEYYLPRWKPDHAACGRTEIYDENKEIFR